MRASLLQRAEYKEWSGPQSPDSTTIPYAFSERVPHDKCWLVLSASGRTFNSSREALWLYAIAPPASYASNGFSPPLRPDIFGPSIVSQFNTPPIKGATQLSPGGVTINSNEIVCESANSQSSVKFLPVFRSFFLPPDWMLAAVQASNGGGGSGFFLTFSAMIIPLDLGEEI